jgi:hypothetical protein
MSTKKLPRCGHCSEPYQPDRYNADRQKYCTRPECVRERRRQRQRRWHNTRYANDTTFAAAARERCAAANRRRRAAGMSRAGPPADPPMLLHVVVGMLSQLTDTVDPIQLRVCMTEYAARGQRVALTPPTGTDPP